MLHLIRCFYRAFFRGRQLICFIFPHTLNVLDHHHRPLKINTIHQLSHAMDTANTAFVHSRPWLIRRDSVALVETSSRWLRNILRMIQFLVLELCHLEDHERVFWYYLSSPSSNWNLWIFANFPRDYFDCSIRYLNVEIYFTFKIEQPATCFVNDISWWNRRA